jgi:release factor glutamine methyltransferase
MISPNVLLELCQSQPDEVRWVLEEKYGWGRGEVTKLLQTKGDAHIAGMEQLTGEVASDLEQLAQGVPVAYIIGWVEFLGCHIDLRYRTLIPRPETEYWAERLITQAKAKERPLKVLDLCCGSGCIGLAVLKHVPESTVDFVDISDQALHQTQLNLELAEVDQARYTLVHSDLFEELNGQYDVILCNPPYVDRFGYYSEHIKHEPEIALFAQNNGLSLIEKIISDLKKYLNEGGEFWLEYGEDQAEPVRQYAAAAGLHSESYKDQFGADRYAIITTTTSHRQS